MIRLLPKKPSFTFLGWAIAFVLVRLLILLSAPLEIYDPEEMFNGTAARELLRGMKLGLSEYLYFPHEREISRRLFCGYWLGAWSRL